MRASALLDRFQHPAQVLATAFGAVVLAGTALLASPLATTTGQPADWLTALFTATSAVCVTGLIVVDTASYWSGFGEVVIIMLVQVGGLGIMTLASLFTVFISGRLGFRARLFAQAESKLLSVADLRRLTRNVAVFSLVSEVITAAILTPRFMLEYGESFGRALYLGVFHSISAFNNAGFALWPDSLIRFASDPWICVTITLAVVLGGLGFPVVFELLRSWRRPSRWSLLTRLTLTVTAVLVTSGTILLTATEWTNPGTFGPLDDGSKIMAGVFAAVMPGSGGFNTVDVAQMYPSSWLVTDLLMFIGGGSAGTAGGIKVTTAGLLVFIVWTEVRGERQVNIGRRRLAESTQRQVVALVVMSATLISLATYTLLVLSPHSLDQVLFEVISAYGTSGLSTGITAEATMAGTLLLTLLMFVGRIGPLTVGSALALKDRPRHYELPEERITVG
ncbi:potassium transporter TrkG [Sphaerisporangium sp. TRM90804]|uniref:TrkH family potassium uptake protein n=1 Tax=Sphaerisporangium sp. TRM90804 TaxID=3031113 RepID=UPI0024472537|nr:potassium transporter TrkG [Sphaerisporangium sp. TRM90804]MDH2428326.1 potassium transporter TrkG [Sphaerisporangium sp. TRM90804]